MASATEGRCVQLMNRCFETHDVAPVSIVLASDERLAMPMSVAAYSAVKNLNGRPADLFILDGGISAASKRKFFQTIQRTQARVHWICPTSERLRAMFNGHHNPRYPMPAYFRLLLPEILSSNLSKVIYLDGDVVVLSDLGRLWDVPVGSFPFLAVQEPDGPYLIDCLRTFNPTLLGKLDLAEFGLVPEHKYCNSGVMVINLEQWRAKHLMEKLLRFVETYLPAHADQDALNVVLAGQWAAIDPRWNVTQAFYEPQRNNPYSREILQEACQHPFVVHFTGTVKPWGLGPERSRHPKARVFYEYGRNTDWAALLRRQSCLRWVRRGFFPARRTVGRGLRFVLQLMVKFT